jgi:hypothetical protein
VGLNALETSLGMLDDAQKDKDAMIITVMCSCDLNTKMSEVKSKMKCGKINSAVICSCGGDRALGEIARAFITRCKIRNSIDGKTKFLQKEASRMQKAFSKDKKSFSLIADAKLEMIKKNGNETNKVFRLLKKVDTANTLELQKIIAKITDFGAFIALTPLMQALDSEFVGVQLSAVIAAKAVARKAYADCDTVDVAALIPLLNKMAEVGKDAENEDLIAAIVDASAMIINGFEKKK